MEPLRSTPPTAERIVPATTRQVGRLVLTRLESLLDAGTLQLRDRRPSGVIAGTGMVDGTKVFAFATDPGHQGGSLGVTECKKIVRTIAAAVRDRSPVIGMWHSGGASLREDPECLEGMGSVFAAMVAASGKVPQLSLVLGPAAGGAAYGPALGDIVVMGPSGRIFVTGPEVVRAATGEEIDAAALGGPRLHSGQSGVAHVVANSDVDAVAVTRRLASMLGSGGRRTSTYAVYTVPADEPDLATLLPDSPRVAYDVHPLLRRLVDERSDMVELQAEWARNMVTALGWIAGKPVGIVANNPLHRCGCLDAASGDKAARFVRLCDGLGIPLLVVVDVPGYLPGVAQEADGVVRRGAKLLHAFAECRVPRVTLITRKAFGGALIAMNSRALGATAVYAWPNAEIGVMDSFTATGILHRRRLEDLVPAQRQEVQATLAQEYRPGTQGIDRAIEAGMVTAVIDPGVTRRTIVSTLAACPRTRGRHGNIPL